MVNIHVFELTLPIRSEDQALFLSQLDSSEIKMLPPRNGKNFGLSLIGLVLTKKIVFDVTHVPQKNILIGETKLGKPIIKTPIDLNLDISISHSGCYLAIGINEIGQIGVDIEVLKDIDFQGFRNCLSVSEEIYINSGKENMQMLENFYEIWTRKEAYSKALGVGLQKPLPITQFNANRNIPKEEIEHGDQKYYLSTLKKDEFILSICTTASSVYRWYYKSLTSDKLRSLVTKRKVPSN